MTRKITKTIPYKPTSSLSFILKDSYEEFESRVSIMPLTILLEELGWLHEARGALIEKNLKSKKFDYFNDPNVRELRKRTDRVQDQILKHYNQQVASVEEMYYFDTLDGMKKSKKNRKDG